MRSASAVSVGVLLCIGSLARVPAASARQPFARQHPLNLRLLLVESLLVACILAQVLSVARWPTLLRRAEGSRTASCRCCSFPRTTASPFEHSASQQFFDLRGVLPFVDVPIKSQWVHRRDKLCRI